MNGILIWMMEFGTALIVLGIVTGLVYLMLYQISEYIREEIAWRKLK